MIYFSAESDKELAGKPPGGEQWTGEKNIQDALNDYEAKLSGLRAALQEASTQAKQATGLNPRKMRGLWNP